MIIKAIFFVFLLVTVYSFRIAMKKMDLINDFMSFDENKKIIESNIKAKYNKLHANRLQNMFELYMSITFVLILITTILFVLMLIIK